MLRDVRKQLADFDAALTVFRNSHGDFNRLPTLFSANVSGRLNGSGLPWSAVSLGFGSNVSM